MTIVRVQHIGIAVKDFQGTLNKFEKVFGLKARDFRDDQGKPRPYPLSPPRWQNSWADRLARKSRW